MSDTDYIYAGTRAKALENQLLSENQMELLLSAKSVDEVHTVLQNTFLAPHLLSKDKVNCKARESALGQKKGGPSAKAALEESVQEAKKVLNSIAPEPKLLFILWLRYDFHNLKAIIKGRRAGQNTDEILQSCFNIGIFSPEEMLHAYEENKLQLLNSNFKEAVDKTVSVKQVFDIDLAMNKYYFKSVLAITEEFQDPFVTEYVKLLINIYNIKAALRAHKLAEVDIKDVYVPGGQFSKKDLENKKGVIDSLKKIGNEKMWSDAIKTCEQTGNVTQIEKTSSEYVFKFLQEKSADLFSPAPLFSYFMAKKNNAQTIGAIIVAKRSGIKEKDLRTILRKLYS